MEPTILHSLQGTYSDMHKDVYGFRPHNLSGEHWNDVEWLQNAVDELEKELERVIAEEKELEAANIVRFEELVQNTMISRAVNRETVIRWLCDGADTRDVDLLCWHYGLPYGYFNEKSGSQLSS